VFWSVMFRVAPVFFADLSVKLDIPGWLIFFYLIKTARYS
jgi:hypothetical protein